MIYTLLPILICYIFYDNFQFIFNIVIRYVFGRLVGMMKIP